MSYFFAPRPARPTTQAEEDGPRPLYKILLGSIWDLLLLNLLCMLCYLPLLVGLWLFILGTPLVVGMGVLLSATLSAAPCSCAMARSVRDFISGRAYEPVRGFLRTFRSEYKSSLRLGFCCSGLLCFFLSSVTLCLWANTAGATALLWITLVLLLLAVVVFFYAFVMLANIELPFGALLRNALLLTFSCPKESLLILIVFSLITSFCFLLSTSLMLSIPLCYFSLIWMLCGAAAWRAVQLRVAMPDTKPSQDNE